MIKLDYGGFVKLMTYLPHEETLIRNGEYWFRWEDYYFCRRNFEFLIRKGSYRESDTLYIHKVLHDEVGTWIYKPEKELVDLIEKSYDYWDLNIG